MKTRIIAAAVAVSLATFGVAHADPGEIIESAPTGPIGTFGVPTAQSFRPATSGSLRSVTLWPTTEPSGEVGELVVHDGDRPGRELGRTTFTWSGTPTVVELESPVPVVAGASYTFASSGLPPQVIFGVDDPYPDGELVLQSSAGWMTWTEWNGRCGPRGCLPYVLDQRFSVEVADDDADGDGVDDEFDECPGTVLPDPSLHFLGTRRHAATADGFVDRSGSVVATLDDTRGCSANQIVEALHLGWGHTRYGLTGAHLDRWIALGEE